MVRFPAFPKQISEEKIVDVLSENSLTAILNWKKNLIPSPGFEPGLPRQNAIALPLVPPRVPASKKLSRLIFFLKTQTSIHWNFSSISDRNRTCSGFGFGPIFSNLDLESIYREKIFFYFQSNEGTTDEIRLSFSSIYIDFSSIRWLRLDSIDFIGWNEPLIFRPRGELELLKSSL